MTDVELLRAAGSEVRAVSAADVDPPRSRPRGHRWAAATARMVAIRVLPLAFFLGVWEFGSAALDAIDVPNVEQTAVAFVEMIGTAELWSAMAESNKALAIGCLTAFAVGIPLGLWIGRSRTVDALAQGWLAILLITPMAMVVPIIIIALGFGVIARSLIIFMFVLPMVVVNSRAGVRSVPTDIIDMSRCFGASEAQLWWRTLLPAAGPAIFVGLRIGVGRAVTGMVIAEWLLAAVGIGALLLQYRGGFRSDSMFALIIVVLLESLVLVQIVRFVERRVTRWAIP